MDVIFPREGKKTFSSTQRWHQRNLQTIPYSISFPPYVSLPTVCPLWKPKTAFLSPVISLQLYCSLLKLHKSWSSEPPFWVTSGLGFSHRVCTALIHKLLVFLFFFINVFIYLFIYVWLCWVFVAVRRLSLVVVSGGYSSLRCAGFSLWLLLLRITSSRHAGFSSCGTWAQ